MSRQNGDIRRLLYSDYLLDQIRKVRPYALEERCQLAQETRYLTQIEGITPLRHSNQELLKYFLYGDLTATILAYHWEVPCIIYVCIHLCVVLKCNTTEIFQLSLIYSGLTATVLAKEKHILANIGAIRIQGGIHMHTSTQDKQRL